MSEFGQNKKERKWAIKSSKVRLKTQNDTIEKDTNDGGDGRGT